MKGYAHRVLGVTAGFAVGHVGILAAGWPWPQALACGAVATLTAGGPTSPDVDQTWAWHLLDRILPDELLGNSGPLQHRGISHWWGLPAAAAAFLAVAQAHTATAAAAVAEVVLGAPLPHAPSTASFPPLWWIAWALLAGWTSHLVGDWFFGLPGQGRGAGIPFAPWWSHRGLGLCSSGGRTATVTTVLLHFVGLGYGLALIGAAS